MVYNGEDGIIPALLWKSHDKIHCNLLERECVFVCCDAVEGYLLLVCEDFVLLTVSTSFYIVGYPLMHSCPAIHLGHFLDCFISPWVSSCRVIMYECH